MKRTAVFLVSILLIAALVTAAAADPAENFLYGSYSGDDGRLHCLGAALPGEGEISVTVGGQALDQWTLATAQEAEIPITYMIIVDQSSAFSMAQKNQQKEALLAFSENMRPIDRMILGKMGTELTIGPVLTEGQARQEAIEEACVYTAWGSDPYQTIVTALDYLRENDSGLHCLVMMSDGIDDWGMDVSESMAREAIRSCGFSVHTFTLVDVFPESYARTNAKRMESLSQESLGGVCVVPNRDQVETAQAVSQIMDAMLQSAVISIDASLLDRSQESLEIQVCWQGEDQTWQGGVTVSTESLPELPTEPEPTEPETTEPETTEPETTEPETTEPETTEPTEPETTEAVTEAVAEPVGGLRSLYAVIGVGVSAVVIFIALIILLLWRQNNWDEPQREPSDGPERPASPGGGESHAGMSGCMVELTPVSRPEAAVKFFLPVHTSMSLGRSYRADVVLNGEDKGLSGVHFQLHWDGRVLFLQDMKSTNGTAVNGLPQKAGSWVRLQKGSLIRAGGFKYNIFFSETD